jgi:DNA polymerase-3 subunit alpha
MSMPALAISDHGNMFGVFEFVAQAYTSMLMTAGKPTRKANRWL